MKKKTFKKCITFSLFLLYVFLFISISKADTWQYNSRNYTKWYNQSGWYDFMGEAIIPNYDLTGIEVIKYGSGETPTKCYLKTLLNVTLDNESFSGNRCYLNTNLIKGEKYRVGYGNDGSGTYSRAFADLSVETPSMPFNMSSFYVINAVQCHTTSCTNLTGYWLGGYGLNVSIGCLSTWANSTPTNWNNITSCSILDIIGQNRSYQRYDTSCGQSNITIWEYRNTTCVYCGSTYENISICNKSLTSSINEIDGVIKMLEIVFMYITFLVLGTYLVKSKERILGIILIGVSVGFDFFLIRYFYLTYVMDQIVEGWNGVFLFMFGISFLFWIMGKIIYPFYIHYQKEG